MSAAQSFIAASIIVLSPTPTSLLASKSICSCSHFMHHSSPSTLIHQLKIMIPSMMISRSLKLIFNNVSISCTWLRHHQDTFISIVSWNSVYPETKWWNRNNHFLWRWTFLFHLSFISNPSFIIVFFSFLSLPLLLLLKILFFHSIGKWKNMNQLHNAAW